MHPQLPFLSAPSTEKSVRVQLYATLGRLVVANAANDGDISDDEFNAFIRPWTDTLNQLRSTLHTPLSTDSVVAVQNLFRHIQGFLSPISSKKAYALVLPWILPHLTSTMIPFYRAYIDTPGVATNFLKLLCEISQNRVSRIAVETSPNGVLLFRCISDALAIYSQYCASLPRFDLDNPYQKKIKGTQSCLWVADPFHRLALLDLTSFAAVFSDLFSQDDT
jgi:exportin-7